jgi:arylsulfatase
MNRRRFIALGSTALLKSGVTPLVSQAAAQEGASRAAAPRTGVSGKPNILMIMADQFRMDCVGAYGNKTIKTPHRDRIVKEGIRFQNAYSCTPSCTPAHSALMTGLGPWRHGMLGYSNIATNPYPVEKAKAMAEAGYYTTSIGKNHLLSN